MSFETLIDKGLLPDWLLRIGIRAQLANKIRMEGAGGPEAVQTRLSAFVAELSQSPVALHTEAANEQHYEVPAVFFERVLGKRLKYSSGYWPEGVSTLDQSEEAMLALYCERARLKDGQSILELGCGWGSLSLYLAEKFPNASITGVSNSHSQREFIEEQARKRGFRNLRIRTADMNQFEPEETFDRIVSIEMFEHMRNYPLLLERISGWLKPDGLLFVHIFCHREFAYPFAAENSGSWMARYFFTGGQMPSQDLLLYFQKNLRIAGKWRVDGRHYQKTCEAWLRNMDRARAEIDPVFKKIYGEGADRWRVYWRIFFMACAELFGYRGGSEWFVAHYLFERQPVRFPAAEGDWARSGAARS